MENEYHHMLRRVIDKIYWNIVGDVTFIQRISHFIVRIFIFNRWYAYIERKAAHRVIIRDFATGALLRRITRFAIYACVYHLGDILRHIYNATSHLVNNSTVSSTDGIDSQQRNHRRCLCATEPQSMTYCGFLFYLVHPNDTIGL